MRPLAPLLLLFTACATAPAAPQEPEPMPPRALSSQEVATLSSGAPLLLSLPAFPVRVYRDHREPEPPCPYVPFVPPVLRIELPFPVRILPLPSQGGGRTLARLVEPSALTPDPTPICRVVEATPTVSRGPLLLQLVADLEGGPQRQREVLLLPEAAELPLLRPDYRPSEDLRGRQALAAVVPLQLPLQTFDGQSAKLWRAAPRSLFVYVTRADPGPPIAAGEPALIVDARSEGAMILLADGLLSWSAWSSLSTQTATVVFPARSRLKPAIPVFPPTMVSQTVLPPPVDPSQLHPEPQPQALEDHSGEQLGWLRSAPRYSSPPLDALLSVIGARQRPLAKRLHACWEATRCSSVRSVVMSCQGAPPGQGCDPPSGPLILSTGICLKDEPYRTLREAETVRAQSCGHLERELAAVMEGLEARVKREIQRWLDQRLEEGVRAFREKVSGA